MKGILKKILKKIFNRKYKKHSPHIVANVVKLSNNELLLNRAALVTGGTSGIGYAIADAMLSAGVAAVVITGRTQERCVSAVEKLLAEDETRVGRVFYEVMDIRDINNFDSSMKNILNKLNDKKLSILVNNAGVQGARFGCAVEEEFDNVMDTNYKGVFFLSQWVAKYMIENNVKGNILNVASASSYRPTNGAYALSKACIKELTAGMAKFLIPYGIVVNGVAPGPTATPMTGKKENSSIYHPSNPSGRFATAEEIANMAVVLCSDMSRMVVGSIVNMTGGAGDITVDDCKYEF